MMDIQIKCVGMTPLIMENKQRGEIPSGRKTDRLIAEQFLYKDPWGNLGLPRANLMACLGETLRRYNGLATSMKLLLPPVEPGVWFRVHYPFLRFPPETEWEVYARKGITKTGGVAAHVRPLFPRWEFGCTISVDTEIVTAEQAKKLIELAGRHNGLGMSRAAKLRPGYGSFGLTVWQVVS